MEGSANMELGLNLTLSSSHPSVSDDLTHELISLNPPTITVAVEKAVQTGKEQVTKEMGKHPVCLNEDKLRIEKFDKMRISNTEDKLYQV